MTHGTAKLLFVTAPAFDAKRTDNFSVALDDPEGASLCLGKHVEKLPKLAIDNRHNISFKQFLHSGRRQFAIDARPQRGHRS
jgi:hypothetical protein